MLQQIKDLQAPLLDNNGQDGDDGTVEFQDESSPVTILWIDEGNDGPSKTPKKRKKEAFNTKPIKCVFLAALLYCFFFQLYTFSGIFTKFEPVLLLQEQQVQYLRKRVPPPTPVHYSSNNDDSNDHQRIVILAGSYVPDLNGRDSTTLQKSMHRYAGQTIWLDPTHKPKFARRPRFPPFSEWSFPVGVPEESPMEIARVGVVDGIGPGPQFHELLGDIMLGSKHPGSLVKIADPEKRAEYLSSAARYYRDLFAVPWSEGSNLIIGTEALTTLVWRLGGVHNGGEARHVDPYADDMLDRLLDVLPSNNNIEVEVGYRSSRIQNTISLWHKYHNGKTLREFLATDSHYLSLINSLALALQFVRKGLKVTLVDTEGAKAFQEANDPHKEDIDHFVGSGYSVLVACDILKIANETSAGSSNTDYCDAKSRLHHPSLSRGTKMPPWPKQRDPRARDMSELELEKVGAILEEYDCGIWKYLQAYEASGLLRVLHPSENLFANCKNNDGDRNLSFADMTKKIKRIAGRDDQPRLN